MLPEIKLVIAQNDKILKSVAREMDTNHFAKAIEAFQVVANATLTKIIDDLGGAGDCAMEELEEDESEADDDICTNPKKKKK